MAEASPKDVPDDSSSSAENEVDLAKLVEDVSTFLDKRREELDSEFTEAISGSSYGLEYFYKSRFGDASSVSRLILPWLPLFRKLKAKSVEEFEKSMKELTETDSELKESYTELTEIEHEWNELLKNQIDPALNQHFGTSLPVSVNSANIHLTDVDTNRMVFLNQYLQTPYTLLILLRFYGSPQCIEHVRDVQRHLEAFTKVKNCSIVLICRGSAEGGRLWRQKTGLNLFPLLADEDSEFVDAFKFGRSVWSSCRTGYVKSIVADIVQSTSILGSPISDVTFARKLASLVRAREEISDGRAMATVRFALRSHNPAIRNFLPGSYERSELSSSEALPLRTFWKKSLCLLEGDNLARSSFQIVMPDKLHDLHQMGGDVVLASNGKIHCLHESRTFTDRPSVEDILGKIPNFVPPGKAKKEKKKKK